MSISRSIDLVVASLSLSQEEERGEGTGNALGNMISHRNRLRSRRSLWTLSCLVATSVAFAMGCAPATANDTSSTANAVTHQEAAEKDFKGAAIVLSDVAASSASQKELGIETWALYVDYDKERVIAFATNADGNVRYAFVVGADRKSENVGAAVFAYDDSGQTGDTAGSNDASSDAKGAISDRTMRLLRADLEALQSEAERAIRAGGRGGLQPQGIVEEGMKCALKVGVVAVGALLVVSGGVAVVTGFAQVAATGFFDGAVTAMVGGMGAGGSGLLLAAAMISDDLGMSPKQIWRTCSGANIQ